ncbi:MAG: ArnT family glycosyltransferase [Isosphaeraceae bacterium]
MRSRGWFGRAVVDPAVKTPHAASWLDRLAARADSFVCPRSSHGLPPDLPRNEAWITRLCWAFVVFGLLVRLVRFLVVYPIWHDEAFLAVNFLDRGYRDLLRPLDYAQVAPVWYLWIELTAVRLFGFSEWSLRLFAAICGLASVLVFRHLASRVLRGAALLLAVAVFATAFHPIRHSAEVKPYASDLLASLLLMTLAVEWWRFPGRSRWLWALAALVPMLLAVSYPAVLVAAAVSLALAPEALRSTHRPVRLAFLTYNIVLAGSFLALYFSFTVVQSTALLSFYRQGWWRDSFPPLGQPWKVPAWLVSVHTGTMMGYPIGEKAGGSTVTFLAAILGGLVVWKAKQPTILRLVTFPFLIGLAASCLGRYPYGGPARVSQYLVPSIILLSGLGGAVLIARASTWKWGKHSLSVILSALAVLGAGLMARDLVRPYRVADDLKSRTFARRFWSEYSQDGDVYCVKTDLGFTFRPRLWRIGVSAVYLCHQRIFSNPKAHSVSRDRPSPTSTTRPVRLVFFDEFPEGNPVFDRWMEQLRQSYDVGRPLDFTVCPGNPEDPWLRDRYLVIELRPRGSDNPLARSLTDRAVK